MKIKKINFFKIFLKCKKKPIKLVDMNCMFEIELRQDVVIFFIDIIILKYKI
jgi:hypothetical protein